MTLTSGSAVVGGSGASIGDVELGGPETSWTISGTMTVANGGQGTVSVSADADLESDSAVIGQQLGSVGDMTVTGSGSTWTINGSLDVGLMGQGNLTICDNAAVFALDTFVTLGTLPSLDQTDGGVGNVTVCGPGSVWFIDGDLYVGFLWLGTLAVQDGGTVVSQSVNVSSGSTIRVINGGTIQPAINGGDLEGDGVLQTPSVSNNTTRVGNPLGTLTIDGNLFSGTAEFEIAGALAGEFDVLSVTGTASIGNVVVTPLEAYVPQVGDTFEIITAGSLGGALKLTLPALEDLLTWFVTQDASTLSLLVTKLGDTNGDAVVDVVDLLELLGTWGPCPGCPADLNGDGVVDVFDLLVLLANFDP